MLGFLLPLELVLDRRDLAQVVFDLGLRDAGIAVPVEQALAATAVPTSSVANAGSATTAINSPPLAWTNGLPASFLNTPVKQEMTPPMGREALLALSGDSAFTSGSPELPKVALTSVGLATGLTLANPQMTSPLPAW